MEQKKGNAVEFAPERGARAEAERRLGINPQLGAYRWRTKQADFVLLVLQIDAEMKRKKKQQEKQILRQIAANLSAL